MKDNVIQGKFPGTPVKQPDPEPEDLKMRFVIGDQDYFVAYASRPTMFHEEWSVFNLNGSLVIAILEMRFKDSFLLRNYHWRCSIKIMC
jgi:hypothetical protein